MHMHARTYFLPSIIISQTQGKLQRQGRLVSTGMKPRTEPLKEERGKRIGKRGNCSRELSLAMNTGKQTVWLAGLGAHQGKYIDAAHILAKRSELRRARS